MGNNYYNPLGKPTTYRKKADDTVNNSIALTDATELAGIPLLAGRVYRLTIYLVYNSSETADFKANVTTTQNATFCGATSYCNVSTLAASHAASVMSVATTLLADLPAGGSAGGDRNCNIVLVGEVTANCTLTIRFAQNTAEVSDTKLKAGSKVIVEEL
jgi:hypothetical protein